MDSSNVLFSVAGIAIAVVGFAGIFFAVRSGAASHTEMENFRLRIMVESGVAAVFFSLAPALLLQFELQESTVWALSSGVLGLTILTYVVGALRRQKKAFGNYMPPEGRTNDLILTALGISLSVVLLVSSSGLLPRDFAIYLLGLFYWLIVSIKVFFRIIT